MRTDELVMGHPERTDNSDACGQQVSHRNHTAARAAAPYGRINQERSAGEIGYRHDRIFGRAHIYNPS